MVKTYNLSFVITIAVTAGHLEDAGLPRALYPCPWAGLQRVRSTTDGPHREQTRPTATRAMSLEGLSLALWPMEI